MAIKQHSQPLSERFRPVNLDDVIGQPAAVKQLQSLMKLNGTLGGRAYWAAGPSGTGKTTIVRIIAGMVSDSLATIELDASSATPKDVDEFLRLAAARPLGGATHWALLLNEAHGLRADTVRRLLTALDPVPRCGMVAFTTTKEGQQALFDDHIDSHPLLTRCTILKMEQRPESLVAPFARHLAEKAAEIGLASRPMADYEAALRMSKSSLRAAWNALEADSLPTGPTYSVASASS